MTTRKKTSKEEILNPGQGEYEADPNAPEIGFGPENIAIDEPNDIARLEQFLKDQDISGGSVRIYRRGPMETKPAYCESIGIEDFDFEAMKNKWGGGHYSIHLCRENGRMYKRFNFSIDPRIKGSADKLEPAGGGEYAGVFEKMVSKMQTGGAGDNSDMFYKMMEIQRQSSDNMMKMMIESQKQTMQLLAAMMNKGSDSNQPELLKAATPLLIESLKQKTNSQGDVLAQFKQFKELIEPPKKEENDDVLDKIGNFLGPVVSALMNRGQTVQPVGQIPSNNGEKPDETEETQENEPQKKESETVKIINLAFTAVMNGARQNADPAAYAQLLRDNTSPDQFKTVMETAKREDWFVQFFGQNEEAKKHLTWLTRLRESLLENHDSQKFNRTAGPEPIPAKDD